MREDKKLTIGEIVSRTGAARSTVYRWCKDGKFPNAERIETPVGAYWLVPEEDLQAVEDELKEVKRGRPKKE